MDMARSAIAPRRHERDAEPGLHRRQRRRSPAAARRCARRRPRREALLDLASTNLGVPASQLSVSKGVVSGGGKTVTYGELIGDKLFNVDVHRQRRRAEARSADVQARRHARCRGSTSRPRSPASTRTSRTSASRDAPRPRRPPARPGRLRHGAKPLSVDEIVDQEHPGRPGRPQGRLRRRRRAARVRRDPGGGAAEGQVGRDADAGRHRQPVRQMRARRQRRTRRHASRQHRQRRRGARVGGEDGVARATSTPYQAHGRSARTCAIADVNAGRRHDVLARRRPPYTPARRASRDDRSALHAAQVRDPVLRGLGRLRPQRRTTTRAWRRRSCRRPSASRCACSSCAGTSTAGTTTARPS